MPNIRIQVIDPFETEMTTMEVPDDVQLSQLTKSIAEAINLPTTETNGHPPIYHLVLRNQDGSWNRLDEAKSLSDNEILQDSLFQLTIEMVAGGGIPIRTFREIQLVEGILRDSSIMNSLDGWVLFAIFLYTNEDAALAEYIREHVREIHEMSSNRCMFFVIEEPSSEWKLDIRKYLGDLTDKYFDAVWKRLGVDSFRPYEKVKAYEIARHLGVNPNQLPCIVFFSSLQSQDALPIELNKFVNTSSGTTGEFAQLFRILFTHAQESMELGIDNCLEKLSKSMKHEEKKLKKLSGTTEKSLETIKLSSSLIEIIGTVIKILLP